MLFLFNNIFIYVNMIIGDSMKKYILTILITAIICITGTVIASNYLASEIVYNDTTVENALNDLYTVHETYKNLTTETTADAGDILSGKTAYDNLGNLITGSISTDCVMGLINSNDGYTSSTPKKVPGVNFKPSVILIMPTDSSWNRFHYINTNNSTTNCLDIPIKASKSDTREMGFFTISDMYNLNDDGLYIHNWAAGYTVKYIACK